MKLLDAYNLDLQLQEMDRVFKAATGSWWDLVYPYYQQMQEETAWKALPPVTIAAFQYLGCDHHSTTFGNIFRIAYFANYIHSTVKDEAEGQEHNRDLQFSILIADLLFGKLTKLLVGADQKRIMMPFAAMICTINEGSVMKHIMKADVEVTTGKIVAPFYETIFLTAAFIADKDREFRELYRQLGFNLGMTIEFANDRDYAEQAYKYLAVTQGLFKQINLQYRCSNSLLEEIISELSLALTDTKSAAVI